MLEKPCRQFLEESKVRTNVINRAQGEIFSLRQRSRKNTSVVNTFTREIYLRLHDAINQIT